MDLILVPGLRALGVHGVLPEEKVRAQPFEVNLELSVDLSQAGQSDDLSDTVSYADVIESVERVITHERFELIERLAQRIADVCRSDTRVTQVVVEVRKLRPPVPVEVGHVAVRIVR
jgi:7,8-dihydroneopterin aldolase/epimerase/oxygenase